PPPHNHCAQLHPINQIFIFFFFNPPPTTEIYTLSLHDALPISADLAAATPIRPDGKLGEASFHRLPLLQMDELRGLAGQLVHLRSEEHTSELQSRSDLVCRLLLEKKKQTTTEYLRSTLIMRLLT